MSQCSQHARRSPTGCVTSRHPSAGESMKSSAFPANGLALADTHKRTRSRISFDEAPVTHHHSRIRAPDRCRASRCPRLMARARTIPARLRPYWWRTTSLPKTDVERFRNRIRNFLGIGIGFLPNMRVFAAVEPIGIAMPAPAARRPQRLPVLPWLSPPRRPFPSPSSSR